MVAEVVTLYDDNHRRPVSETLRQFADRIDAGEFGHVGSAAVVIMGDTLEVEGFGPDSEPCSLTCILQAAAMRVIREIERHGRNNPDGD
jgi:hypothetical protein